MEKLNSTGKRFGELSHEEAMAVVGGNDIAGYVRCVGSTLTKGGGGLRTFVLGTTLFGLARLCGVLVGCSNL